MSFIAETKVRARRLQLTGVYCWDLRVFGISSWIMVTSGGSISIPGKSLVAGLLSG